MVPVIYRFLHRERYQTRCMNKESDNMIKQEMKRKRWDKTCSRQTEINIQQGL